MRSLSVPLKNPNEITSFSSFTFRTW